MAALDKVHVPNTIYVFEQGGHGFGLINKTSEKKWFDAFLSWMSTLN